MPPFNFQPPKKIRYPTSHSSLPFHPSISAAQSCMASSRLRRQRRRTSTSLPSAAGSDAKGAASAMSSAYGPNSRKSLMMMMMMMMMMLTKPTNPLYKKETPPNLHMNWMINSWWSFCWWKINQEELKDVLIVFKVVFELPNWELKWVNLKHIKQQTPGAGSLPHSPLELPMPQRGFRG